MRIAPEQLILSRRGAGECRESGERRKRGQCDNGHTTQDRDLAMVELHDLGSLLRNGHGAPGAQRLE